MTRRMRRNLLWIALLALVFHAGAPVLAAIAPLRAAPAACLSSAHGCSCPAETHAGGSCCCRTPASAFGLHRLPCDGGTAPAAAPSTPLNPSILPPSPEPLPATRLLRPAPALPIPTVRASAALPQTPPPRLPSDR